MPLPAAVPIGMSIGGAILGRLGGGNPNAKRDQRASQREGVAQAARARLIQGILRGYGIENLIDPGMMKNLVTPVPGAVSTGQGGNWAQFAGGMLQAAAPYIPTNQNQNDDDSEGNSNSHGYMPGPGGMSFPPITRQAMGNLNNPVPPDDQWFF